LSQNCRIAYLCSGKFEESQAVRKLFAVIAANLCIFTMYLLLPVLPLLATLIFTKLRFALEYKKTIRAMLVHIAALRKGPTVHFFQDILGQVSQVPDDIHGECVQCGNCCMNHQCAFLEKIDDGKFQCGVYHSPFRRLSNCGSFPLNKHDIERYACPSYFAHAPELRPVNTSPRVIPIQLIVD